MHAWHASHACHAQRALRASRASPFCGLAGGSSLGFLTPESNRLHAEIRAARGMTVCRILCDSTTVGRYVCFPSADNRRDFAAVLCVQLAEDVPDMKPDSIDGDEEVGGDLVIRLSGAESCSNFLLARGEAMYLLVMVTRRRRFRC